MIINVECALIQKDNFLIIQRPDHKKHAAGKWAFPGGKVELHDPSSDTLESAVRREVFEEVGIQIMDPLHYIYNTMFSIRETSVINVLFGCFIEKTSSNLIPNPLEVSDCRWMSEQQLVLSPKTPPWLLTSLEKVKKTMI